METYDAEPQRQHLPQRWVTPLKSKVCLFSTINTRLRSPVTRGSSRQSARRLIHVCPPHTTWKQTREHNRTTAVTCHNSRHPFTRSRTFFPGRSAISSAPQNQGGVWRHEANFQASTTLAVKDAEALRRSEREHCVSTFGIRGRPTGPSRIQATRCEIHDHLGGAPNRSCSRRCRRQTEWGA